MAGGIFPRYPFHFNIKCIIFFVQKKDIKIKKQNYSNLSDDEAKKKKKEDEKVDEVLSFNSEIEIYDQGEKKKKVGDNKRNIDFQV